MSHAYVATNQFGSLAAAAFTWSNAAATNRSRLNDGRMDSIFSVGVVAGGVNVVIDMGAAVSLAGIALLGTNIASAGGTPTAQVKAADDAAITVNVVTPKAVTTLNVGDHRKRDHVLQWAAVSKRYWQILWTWTGNFALTIGELFAYAAPTQLSRGVVYGDRERIIKKTTAIEFDDGEVRGNYLSGGLRTRFLPFKELTQSQTNELFLMWDAANGNVGSLLWVNSYEAVSTAAASSEQDCIWGRFSKAEFGWAVPDLNLYDPDALELRSLGRQIGA